MSTVYHFCSTHAFKSIVENKQVWLTDLHQTNDKSESLSIIDTVSGLLKEHDVEQSAIDGWCEEFRHNETLIQGFGFCLSRHRDMLSQWRGYANDGTGFAIGLNEGKLSEKAKSLNKNLVRLVYQLADVLYEYDDKKKRILEVAPGLARALSDGALKYYRKSLLIPAPSQDEMKRIKSAWERMIMANLTLNIFARYALKDPAFSEEDEVRLFAAGNMPRNSGRQKSDQNYIKQLEDYNFLSREDTIIPFVKFPISDPKLLDEVVLGPRNLTPPHVVEKLLLSYGFEDVSVSASEIPYT